MAYPAYRSASVNFGSAPPGTTPSLSMSLPTGWQEGDIAFLVVYAWDHTSNASITFNTPSGWTLADEQTIVAGSRRGSSALFWRRLQGGDSGPTVSGTMGDASTSNSAWMAYIVAFEGAATTGTPFEGLLKKVDGMIDNLVCPGNAITTDGAERLAVQLWAVGDDGDTTATPSGWTEEFHDDTTVGGDVTFVVQTRQVASATTLAQADLTFAAALGDPEYHVYSFALFATTVEDDEVEVDAGALTIAGQTVDVNEHERIAVDHGALTVTGQGVDVADAEVVPVDAGALTVAGQNVDVVEHERVAVDHGALTVAGQAVTETEAVAVTSGTLTIAGQTVDVADISPDSVTVEPGALTIVGQTVEVWEAIPGGRAKGGGGGGPASAATIQALEAHERAKRERWRRIEETIEGKKPETPKPPQRRPERSRKPLPETRSQAIAVPEIAEPSALEILLQELAAAEVASFIPPVEIRHYDPDEDAAVLLLLD